jgi:broad specificity phosphatase PhoE
MSTLYLVRHGQGGRPPNPYDQLSELGHRQARTLGEYWLERGLEFDEAYTGTLRRQKETAQGVRDAFQAAGKPFPDTEILEGLNEYNADDVIKQLLPELSGRFKEIDLLRDALDKKAGDHREQMKNFQRMFEAVMRHWVKGDHEEPTFEPYHEFRGRVVSALESIRKKPGSGRRVAVFTSGGPIGISIATVLGAPDHTAMEINWRVKNTSITEFIYSERRISLEAFNTLPHLEREPALVSLR